MSDLVRMSPEDFDALSQQMKLANTQRFKALLDHLEPYVDGSLGAVSPGHVSAYVKVAVELGKLWSAYDRPRPPEVAEVGVDEELMVLAARQEAVLAELGKLRAVGMRQQGRRAP